jgi:hypothetical protein
MQTLLFTTSGAKEHDFWLVDGNPDLGHMPTNIEGIESLPIRLKIGNVRYGQLHIDVRHGVWLSQKKETACSMVHKKLQQTGKIYITESDGKLKIHLSLSPNALLLLHLHEWKDEKYYSVISIYPNEGALDGDFLGRYVPRR